MKIDNQKRMQIILIFIFINILMPLSAEAQVVWNKKTLTRGKLWATLWNSFQYGDPVEVSNAFHTLDYPGYSKGANIDDALNYADAAGYAIYGVHQGVAFAYTINSRFFPSGEYIYPNKETTLIKNFNLVDPSIAGEEIITGGHHVLGLEVDLRRRSMVWSYPAYDDFIIHEVIIRNVEFSTLENVYFGMRYAVRITQRSGTRGDEKFGWEAKQKFFYFYDDRSFRFDDETPVEYNFGVGPNRGDIADARDIWEPGTREHELDAAGYFSVIVLDSAGGQVFQNILEHVGQGRTAGAPKEDIIFIQGADRPDRFKEVMTHQQPRLSWDAARAAGGEGGNKYERRPEFLISVGPLTLTPFQEVKLVFAEVIGEMDRTQIVEGGVENIDRLPLASLEALSQNIMAAKELYASNYRPAVHPPMTPADGENSLELEIEPGKIILRWPQIPDTYRDPATGNNDFAGYRIYRSTYFTIGPWSLVAEIPKAQAMIEAGLVKYEDTDLPEGVGNYYCVTSYDLEGNESGKVNNNRFPVYPLRKPNPEFPKNVYVVPNPFRQHSGLLGQGERYRIEFIGLPAKCNIKIYTPTGDLIQELHHDDGSGSTAWGSVLNLDYQLNKWMLGISPGVYVFLVESLVEGQKGEVHIGKFAIMK
ncbi:hypothetical protein L0128_08070 [candidate division KSB1 bacterium]|nr:hypothetical protein [candidate division KSB1 bacterium]